MVRPRYAWHGREGSKASGGRGEGGEGWWEVGARALAWARRRRSMVERRGVEAVEAWRRTRTRRWRERFRPCMALMVHTGALPLPDE